jgi:hypothetical protein
MNSIYATNVPRFVPPQRSFAHRSVGVGLYNFLPPHQVNGGPESCDGKVIFRKYASEIGWPLSFKKRTV